MEKWRQRRWTKAASATRGRGSGAWRAWRAFQGNVGRHATMEAGARRLYSSLWTGEERTNEPFASSSQMHIARALRWCEGSTGSGLFVLRQHESERIAAKWNKWHALDGRGGNRGKRRRQVRPEFLYRILSRGRPRSVAPGSSGTTPALTSLSATRG